MKVRVVSFDNPPYLESAVVHDIVDIEPLTPSGKLTAPFAKLIADLIENDTWVGNISIERIPESS